MEQHPKPRGRQAEAALNDQAILAAAQEVFTADADAPIAAVARRARVGIGALYHRYPSKEALIATVAARGQETYLEVVREALAAADAVAGYRAFLARLVELELSAITVRLAGTFTPDPEHLERSDEMARLTRQLVDRVRVAGSLRDDVDWLDVAVFLEALSQVRFGDADRTRQVRQRLLTVMLDGMVAREGLVPLPGEPPTWAEQQERWTGPAAQQEEPAGGAAGGR